MKLSQAIELLQAALQTHGDIDLLTPDDLIVDQIVIRFPTPAELEWWGCSGSTDPVAQVIADH